jgi:tetratricopeptide (TPR) repeat protein
MTPFESGRAALAARDWPAAKAAFTQAAAAAPEAAGPWIGLSRVHRFTGADEQAESCLAQALAREPHNVDALNNLAQLRRARDPEGATALLVRAHAGRPKDATIFLNLMGLLGERRKHDHAIRLARAWLADAPGTAFVHTALAEALFGATQYEAALDAAGAALAMDAFQTGARLVAAQALDGLGRHREALTMARTAFSLRGGDVKARLVLAQCLANSGETAEALALAKLAAAASPGDPKAALTLARAAFLAGRYDLAWPAFEQRWAVSPGGPPKVPARPWRGEDVAGKTVLLVAEQGLGDTIHFARYAWEITARGGRVMLHGPDDLACLFTRAPAGIRFAGAFDPANIDYWAPLLSAPWLLGMTAPMAPPPGYVSAPAHRSPPAALAGPGVKVGLVWAGNPDHPNDALRSAGLAALSPLLATPGVLFFSLQKGAAAAQRTALGLDDMICDLAQLLGDWGDTAAALGRLDLLISVDSAPAHLAGALGRPVWIAAPFSPDWRWAPTGNAAPASEAPWHQTAWYPGARIYRQSQERDWTGPAARMAADLAVLVERLMRGEGLGPDQR